MPLRLRAPSLLPCRRVFPQGLPEEFALVLTVLLKKQTFRNTWYLFQVTDANGYPQVSPPLPSPTPWATGCIYPAQLLPTLVVSGGVSASSQCPSHTFRMFSVTPASFFPSWEVSLRPSTLLCYSSRTLNCCPFSYPPPLQFVTDLLGSQQPGAESRAPGTGPRW